METNITFAVLAKISNLLIQESDSVLEVEQQIECIESILRKHAHLATSVDKKIFREIIYDIEDVIDKLIIRAAKRRARDALIQIVLPFVTHVPKHFFHVFAILDLTDCYKLHKKLEVLKVEISSLFSGFLPFARSWEKPFGLSTGNAVIAPVIAKLATMATQEQLSPVARKQARWLRDELKSLHSFLEDVKPEDLSKDGMPWMEELFNVCRATENVVGLFMSTHMRNRNTGAFKNIVWAPQKFISQHKLSRKMALIKDKICNISNRRYSVIPRMHFFRGDDFTKVYGHGKAHPFAVDQLDMVSFVEDIDGVMAKLLKDDPRCLAISIIGVAGIGKTSLASLIYHSKVIADHC